MKKYLKSISLLFLYLAVIFMALSMFLSFNSSSHLSVICFYISGITGLLQTNFKNIIIEKENKMIYLSYFILIILYLISYLLNPEKSEFNEFEKRINILIIPILIFFIPIEKNHIKIIIHLYIGTVLSRNIIAFFNVILTHGIHFDFNNGAKINAILLGERPFIGSNLLLSGTICLFYYYTAKYKHKWVYLLCCVIQFLFIIFISAKMAFLGFIIISILISYWNFIILKKNYKVGILIFLSIISISFIGFFLSTSLQKRFIQILNKDERTFIFKTTINCFTKNNHSIYLGYFSENKAQESLKEEYAKELQAALYMPHRRWMILKNLTSENKNTFDTITIINKKYDESDGRYWYSYFRNFNSHNQFLNLYLSYGILGISILSYLLFIHFYVGFKNSNPLLILIAFCMFLFMLTENILSKEQSIILYVGLFNIFMKTNNNSEK